MKVYIVLPYDDEIEPRAFLERKYLEEKEIYHESP